MKCVGGDHPTPVARSRLKTNPKCRNLTDLRQLACCWHCGKVSVSVLSVYDRYGSGKSRRFVQTGADHVTKCGQIANIPLSTIFAYQLEVIMNSPKVWLVFLSVCLAMAMAHSVFGQGYYERNVQRNPVTGRLEVVPPPNVTGRWTGPNRDYGGFYGSSFNPYSGTASQSQVQRNPVTGRLSVQNEYYNPWTGARVESVTRYNPITRRYETVQMVTPPNKLPAQDRTVTQQAKTQNETARTKPRVIEAPPPPTLNPPTVESSEN